MAWKPYKPWYVGALPDFSCIVNALLPFRFSLSGRTGHILILCALYAIMLLRWGYEFGRNDQMQTLAYTEFLADPSDWPNDFYLQGIHEHVPNERFVFSRLWVSFAGHLDIVSLLGHAIFSLLLLHLLVSLAGEWIRYKPLQWAVTLFLFVPLYGIGLGGNELWYNSFFVSNVVKVLGLAGLIALFRGRSTLAFAAAALATLFQPVVGIQLFGLSLAAVLWERWRSQSGIRWRDLLAGCLLWGATAGIWVLFLKLNFEDEALQQTDHFFDILYVFRAPHHYWPRSWGMGTWLLESALIGFGFWWFARQARLAGEGPRGRAARRITGLFAGGLLACGLYVLAQEFIQSASLGALQAFKVTIWLEALSVIAVVAAVQYLFSFLGTRKWTILTGASLGLAGLSAAAWLFLAPASIPLSVPHDYGVSLGQDPAVAIARDAQRLTTPEALFAHPISFTELKFHGRRSAYVDYKVLVHTRAAMHEWARRVELLYGLQWDRDAGTANRYDKANTHFAALDSTDLDRLRAEGITHLLTFADAEPPGLADQLLVRNGVWAIYTLVP